MKCTICGAEVDPNGQFCNNCGTRVIEMGGNFGAARNQSQYGSNQYGNQYGSQYGTNQYGTNQYGNQFSNDPFANQQSFGTSAFKQKRSFASNYMVIRIVVFVIALLVGFYMGFLRSYITKTFDMDGFSIKLPSNMSVSDERNKYSLGLADSGTDITAKCYANRRIEFAYIKYDLSSEQYKGALDILTEERFAELMAKQLDGSLKGYKKISLSGDTLKFNFNNDEGDTAYAVMKVMKNGDNLYMMICMADNSKRSTYESKFKDYLDSIKFK